MWKAQVSELKFPNVDSADVIAFENTLDLAKLGTLHLGHRVGSVGDDGDYNLEVSLHGRDICVCLHRNSMQLTAFTPLVCEVVAMSENLENQRAACVFPFDVSSYYDRGDYYDDYEDGAGYQNSSGEEINANDPRLVGSFALARCSTLNRECCRDNYTVIIRVRIVAKGRETGLQLAAASAKQENFQVPRGSMLSLLVDPELSLADVRLVGTCRGSSVPVLGHRLILASQSAVLRRMLTGSFKEGSDNIIPFEGISARGLCMVVRHLYGSSMDTLHNRPGHGSDGESWTTNHQLFVEMYQFSSTYMLADLRKDCEKEILTMFSSRSTISIRENLDFYTTIVHMAILQESNNVVLHLASCLHNLQLPLFETSTACKESGKPVYSEGVWCGELCVPESVLSFMNMDSEVILALARELPATLRSLSFLWSWLSYPYANDSKNFRMTVHSKAVVEAFGLDEMSLTDLKKSKLYCKASKVASADVLMRIIHRLASACP